MNHEPVYTIDPVSRNRTIAGYVRTEPNTLEVTPDQYAALRTLAGECERSGLFNEDRWVAGVREIIGYELPIGPYIIKVI